jgi:hypothetical protein
MDFLINWGKKFLAKRGRLLTKRTDLGDITSLLELLWPIRFERGLVRFGPNRDGGYLLPNDLDDIRYLFSPGVSDESGFEKDCADRGMTCFLADGSVDGPLQNHPNFVFRKQFVGAVADSKYMTVDSWVSESIGDNDSDLLLQMDIEGFEYETLLAMPDELLSRFRIIIVEFHFLDRIWNEAYFNYVSVVFRKLLSSHSVVHSHPNNAISPVVVDGLEIPPLLEITFLRKDRINSRDFETRFPHELDVDCCNKRPLVLPRSLRHG